MNTLFRKAEMSPWIIEHFASQVAQREYWMNSEISPYLSYLYNGQWLDFPYRMLWAAEKSNLAEVLRSSWASLYLDSEVESRKHDTSDHWWIRQALWSRSYLQKVSCPLTLFLHHLCFHHTIETSDLALSKTWERREYSYVSALPPLSTEVQFRPCFLSFHDTKDVWFSIFHITKIHKHTNVPQTCP